jgi:hypothetical protein
MFGGEEEQRKRAERGQVVAEAAVLVVAVILQDPLSDDNAVARQTVRTIGLPNSQPGERRYAYCA